jgi:uncharacterized protein YxjI
VSNLNAIVAHTSEIHVIQRKELAELFGFETRNKYAIEADGVPFAFAAEQGKGGLAFLARMFLGHYRTFEIHFFDAARSLVFRAIHPFRWFFQRLDVFSAEGRPIGALQQRFAFFYKSFDVLDPSGNVLLSVRSPLFRPWTFSLTRYDQEVARIEKKWSGVLREAFTDADRFRVLFLSPDLGLDERTLVLAGAVFVDLMYFEQKAS